MTFALILMLFFVTMLVASIYLIRFLNRAKLKMALKNETEPAAVIANLEKVVRRDPGDFDSWLKLVEAYRAKGNYDDAIRRLNELVSRASGKKGFDVKGANSLLADCYIKTRRPDEAYKVYAFLHKAYPDDPMPYFQMARIEKGRGNAEKAIHYLHKAQTLAPEDVDVLKELAILTHDTVGDVESRAMFESVLNLRPDDVESHFHLGQIEMQAQDFKAAYPHFIKSKDTSEFAARSFINIGIILSRFGKLENAQKVLTAVLRLQSLGRDDMLDARYQLGEALFASKDLPGAIAQWEKILAAVKEYRDVREKLERFEHTKTNSLLHTYMICPYKEFIELCERIAKNFAKNVIVIRSEPQRDQSLEINTQASYKEMSGPILFKFFRGTGNVGQLAVREFYEKFREMKAKFGICFTTAEYSEEANVFASGRVLELHGRRELARLLSKKKPI
jgi:tetratricopeptide (TPR) repeat protein